jgi:hypothetical protein
VAGGSQHASNGFGEMKKKVIFVQGTQYSGSTFFHMQLANDPRGFACGEAHGLFRPHKANHVNRDCTCGFDYCKVWPRVLPCKASGLYRGIFDLFPDVDFVVDSSKQPFWILYQHKNLQRQGIEYSNILIWKTPLEFADSMKRKQESGWADIWLKLHRLYLTEIPGLRTVKYQDLVAKSDTLQLVCESLGIPFFAGKEQYWTKQHCVLGGSKTAKYHLYDGARSTDLYNQSPGMTKEIGHRKIDYVPVIEERLQSEVEAVLAADSRFAAVTRVLEYCDVSNKDFDEAVRRDMAKEIRVPRLIVDLKRLKYYLRSAIGGLRYRNVPRFRDAANGPVQSA